MGRRRDSVERGPDGVPTANPWGVVGSNVLKRLLNPFQPEAFINEWWSRRSLLIKGTPQKFRELFDRDRFMSAVRYGAARPHLPAFRLNAVVRDFDGAWCRTELIDPDHIPAALTAGSTVCVNDISVGDEDLADFCEQVRRELSFAGATRCNAYLSQNDSGTDMHIDTSITTALQLEGTKRWRYAREPAVPWPKSNAHVQRDGTRVWALPWVGKQQWEYLPPLREDDFDEALLEPGDLLCLPAGTWHSTRAVGSSLALNLAFAPLDFFTVMLGLLKQTFEASPQWRGGVPPVYGDGVLSSGLPPRVREYMNARLADLSQQMASLGPDTQATRYLWQKLADGNR